MRGGALYRMTCVHCLEKGKKAQYVGEMGRTPFDRGLEHLNAIRRGDEESPLVEHHRNNHPEVQPMFRMEVLDFPKTNLQRQVKEGVLIGGMGDGVEVLNRRGE